MCIVYVWVRASTLHRYCRSCCCRCLFILFSCFFFYSHLPPLLSFCTIIYIGFSVLLFIEVLNLKTWQCSQLICVCVCVTDDIIQYHHSDSTYWLIFLHIIVQRQPNMLKWHYCLWPLQSHRQRFGQLIFGKHFVVKWQLLWCVSQYKGRQRQQVTFIEECNLLLYLDENDKSTIYKFLVESNDFISVLIAFFFGSDIQSIVNTWF